MGKIEVVGSGRVPEIKAKSTEMLNRWVNEFVDELEAGEGDLESDVNDGIVLAAWMTACFSMYQHIKKLVERHGHVIEVPQNIDNKA